MANCLVTKLKASVNNPDLPTWNFYENAVDMGLPSGTKWSKYNIDVTQPEGFTASEYQYECSFFTFGNIDGHNPASGTFDYTFSQDAYDITQGASLTGDIPTNRNYDAAIANNRNPWRIPSKDDFAELFNSAYTKFIDENGNDIPSETTDKRVRMNGVYGVRIKSLTTNNILFFPICGYAYNTSVASKDYSGYYLSSSVLSNSQSYILAITQNFVNTSYDNGRKFGVVIRPCGIG